jgi:aminopeptidase N
MKRFLLTLVGCLVLTPSLAAAAGRPEDSERVVLPTAIVPLRYDLDVTPDTAAKRFSGTVKIAISVSRPTSVIVLNAADLELHRFSVTRQGSRTVSVVGSEPDVALDEARETATLRLPSPLLAGDHVLTIEYTGTIHDNAGGLFGLTYDTPGGPKRALFTQFENSDARRFLPCWDEPALKATFTLAVTLPAADMAVSNMPIARSETLPHGKKHVHFATTPRMSTYLLFFGAGDFERVARTVNGVDIGVIVKRGDAPKARYALDTVAQVLPYYEEYFGMKFPLPKLDLVAGPGRSQFFSAMENWGAIFCFEHVLESDPTLSTEADRRTVYIDIAHEVAHQWFGDLVTMRWWDELWLNEGFASWMTGKVTDHFHPDWRIPLEAMSYTQAAMMLDARLGTHPIVQPIRDVREANQVFDDITYNKGMAVITMLEADVGEDAFRAGVRQYIRKHAYGNTVSDDLWSEIDKTATQPVTSIAHDFTLQAGVPLVRVVDREHAIELRQGRFTADAPEDQLTMWHVPVSERSLGTGSSWRGVITRDHPGRLERGSGGAIIVNVSHTGYFRTLYSPTLFHLLVASFGALAPADQVGLLGDTQTMAYSGLQPLSDFLELAGRITPDTDPAVLSVVSDELRDLDERLDGLAAQARLREYARNVLDPVFARTGWTAAAADSAETRELRASVLATLSRLGDPRVIGEARARFTALRADPKIFAADLRESVLAVIGENADAAAWDELHAMARHAGSFLEKERLYATLGTARDPELAQRALQLTLADEVEVTLRPELIKRVAESHSPDAAFEFVSAHFRQVDEWLEPDSRNQFAARLLRHSGNPAMIARLRSYAEEHIPTDARKEVVVGEATIAYNARIRAQQLPGLDLWLQNSH